MKKNNLQKIKIYEENKIDGFNVLLTNGSMVCLPDNEYIVPEYVLSELLKRGIKFKLEKSNEYGSEIKSSISNTSEIQ